jgi:hypothetical protein
VTDGLRRFPSIATGDLQFWGLRRLHLNRRGFRGIFTHSLAFPLLFSKTCYFFTRFHFTHPKLFQSQSSDSDVQRRFRFTILRFFVRSFNLRLLVQPKLQFSFRFNLLHPKLFNLRLHPKIRIQICSFFVLRSFNLSFRFKLVHCKFQILLKFFNQPSKSPSGSFLTLLLLNFLFIVPIF